MFKVGERVRILTPEGFTYGTVVRACSDWYWKVCRHTLDLKIGNFDLPIKAAA